MGNKNFCCAFSARIDAGEAIKRISKVPEWWGVTFSGSSEKQGDQFKITMTQDSFFDCTVTELVAGKRVVWLVTECNMPWYTDKTEWVDTRMVFDLSPDHDMTKVVFTHEGLTPDVECYNDCETGWTHWIVTSLASYLSTGKGVFRAPTK